MAEVIFNNRPDVRVKNDVLPETPGVYLMKDAKGRLLYVGKAGNLRRRVSSYFSRPHDARIEKLVSEIKKIDYIETDTALEALILEASLIKNRRPPYNIKDKDDKSFLYIEVTKDEFPRVVLVRGKSARGGKRFGPFTSASSVRTALKIIRKIFPFSVHPPEMVGKFTRPCFDYEIGLCPGTCVGKADRKDYLINIRNIEKLLDGHKRTVIRSLERRMVASSARLEFEEAQILKRQIFSLQHIEDTALISHDDISSISSWRGPHRIEGYDISNISGTAAVGSMVVFIDGKPDKAEYRMFKIRTVKGANDVGMIQEVIRRRFGNSWAFPDLILVDGGLGQVNAAREVLTESKMKIPVVGMIKGPDRKDTRLVGSITGIIDKGVLVRVRDEAHRFAINFHRRLRSANMIKK
jgi:excinuclease ABC subunit C